MENWRLARDGSGRTISRISTLSWLDGILAAALSVAWLKVASVLFYLRLFSQTKPDYPHMARSDCRSYIVLCMVEVQSGSIR